MAAPFDTLSLGDATWDLEVDGSGNIAVSTGANAVAQDMGSACRLYLGEYIYNASVGVPLATILGQSPSLGAMKSDFIIAAQTVPGTSSVKCFVAAIADRKVRGQVQATVTTTGQVVAAPFTTVGAST